MSTDAYLDFLARKTLTDPPTGLTRIPQLPDALFPHQRDIVQWALRRGRSAIFANTGLGKSLMELAWGNAVCKYTKGTVLLLTPLAVAGQMVREATRFGIPAKQCATHDDVRDGTVNITNYAKLHHFDMSAFSGVVLDESSILKSFDGKTRAMLVETCKAIPYRLAATATPAPNDHVELGNHAEFLGVMSLTGMQSIFFTHDSGDTGKWRLKGHAEAEFWRWMCTWSVLIRKPSDLGYPDRRYTLPPLRQVEHIVEVEGVRAQTLSERIKARRTSIGERVTAAGDLVPRRKPCVIWCNLNDESAMLADTIRDAVEIRGSDSEARKEEVLNAFAAGDVRVLITKPTLTGFGLNWQHCCDTIFVGLNDSFEQLYQAVRRFWRFGQRSEVTAHFIIASTEGEVLKNLKRKEADAERMAASMVAQMSDITKASIHGATRTLDAYSPQLTLEIPKWLR